MSKQEYHQITNLTFNTNKYLVIKFLLKPPLFKNFIHSFFYFWLPWVFIAVCMLSLVVGAGLLFVAVFRLLRWSTGCRTRRLNSCGDYWLSCGMWDLPRPRIRTGDPCFGRQILNFWNTREALKPSLLSHFWLQVVCDFSQMKSPSATKNPGNMLCVVVKVFHVVSRVFFWACDTHSVNLMLALPYFT